MLVHMERPKIRCRLRCILLAIGVLIICWISKMYVFNWTAPPLKPQTDVVQIFPPNTAAKSEEQYEAETATEAQHPLMDPLIAALDAIERALDFVSTQTESLNLDGILGLRVVDDQFTLLLEKYNSYFVNMDILASVSNLRSKARNLSDTAIPYTNISEPDYFHDLGSILRKGMWALDYPLQTLQDANQTWPDLPIQFEWNTSDSCLHDILGFSSDAVAPCEMSDGCWMNMTFPVFSGYGLTHQLLYVIIAEIAGCSSQISNFTQTYNQHNTSTVHNFLCGHILSEANAIQSNGVPENYQDLFMEQIFVCGILGYQEFLTIDWLEDTISWQDSSGCYGIQFEKERRRKREERLLVGNCASHKTSVALGMLATYVRFFLLSMFENETRF